MLEFKEGGCRLLGQDYQFQRKSEANWLCVSTVAFPLISVTVRKEMSSVSPSLPGARTLLVVLGEMLADV